MSDLDWIEVDLVPQRVLLGGHDGGPERGVLYFGRPFTTSCDLESASASVRDFAREHRDAVEFRRLVVHLNLAPRAGEPITYVTVSAVIEPPHGRALFWEPSPLRQTRNETRDTKFRVSANIGPLQQGAEAGSQYEAQDDIIVARGVGTGAMQWEFKRKAGRALDGVHELTAAVSMPTGTTGSVLLSAAAGIRKRRVGLIGHRAELPPDAGIVPLP